MCIRDRLKEMQSLALDVNVVSEEGNRADVREEDDDLLRAAEELGIDLSGVRTTDGQSADESTDSKESSEEEGEAEPAEEPDDSDAEFIDEDIPVADVTELASDTADEE